MKLSQAFCNQKSPHLFPLFPVEFLFVGLPAVPDVAEGGVPPTLYGSAGVVSVVEAGDLTF